MSVVDNTNLLVILDDSVPASFAVRAYASEKDAPRPEKAQLTLTNIDGKTIATQDATLTYSPKGRGEAIVTFDSLPIGFYQVDAKLSGDDQASALACTWAGWLHSPTPPLALRK